VFQRLFDKMKSEPVVCGDCETCELRDETPAPDSVENCFERLHQREKEDLLRLLDQTGATLSPVQMQIVDEFLKVEGHLSTDYLKERLDEKSVRVSMEEVENVLDLLCRYGLAQKVQLNGRGPWYEHLHVGERHDHLLCMRCGKVVEFEHEELDEKVRDAARQYGFEPITNKCTIYGVCPECRSRHGRSLPLTMVSPGEKVKITDFNGGTQLRKRLSDMGISIGQEVEVLNRGGPVIVSVKGSRVALGKGLAQKVIVSPVSG
jgi:Fur family ferric uptake transcriptional regulator